MILSPEQDNSSTPRWFSGALEIGGQSSFDIKRDKRGILRSYPFMAFSDTDNPSFLQDLRKRFGGHISPSRLTLWRIHGYEAAEIGASTEPYTVIRHEAALAMENWLDADMEERVRIAQDLKNGSLSEADYKRYQELTIDPAFMAGAIDNRGPIAPQHHNSYESTGVKLKSVNKPLLDAIQTNHGGSLQVQTKAGSLIRAVPGHEYTTKRDSYVLVLKSAQARALISFALPYLKTPPFEGWDELLIDRIREGRKTETDNICIFVQDELAKFKVGETLDLSTNAQLADLFGLSHRTTMRRLSALPANIAQERRTVLRQNSGKFHKKKSPGFPGDF